jgi:DNA-directed RNA polymerase specialized sigma24 family protein
VSILRIKARRALQTYDPTRSSMSPERYVFSCVKNQCHDLVKRKRRDELFNADLADDAPTPSGRATYRPTPVRSSPA